MNLLLAINVIFGVFLMTERNYALGCDVIFDVLKREVISNHRLERLGGRESAILHLLCERANQVITKDEMHEKVWGKVLVSETSLTKAISNLRKVLACFDTLECEIKTVPKEGYLLIIEDSLINQSVDDILYVESKKLLNTSQSEQVYSNSLEQASFNRFRSDSQYRGIPISGTLWLSMTFFSSLLASAFTVGLFIALR
ncbi:putative transcriptional activator ToxR [Vibrio caribbeanicus ATCC BAA-2122]|uniref:Putative transcriptional activator ToxR n=2 Tax=Vibrio caribbeanicus TaxID=701175 RepID=E3BET3_9VIBR|nr:putative transcriptional activator ToxR [Vibrio caribbeanicus ATCC BAA-2122]